MVQKPPTPANQPDQQPDIPDEDDHDESTRVGEKLAAATDSTTSNGTDKPAGSNGNGSETEINPVEALRTFLEENRVKLGASSLPPRRIEEGDGYVKTTHEDGKLYGKISRTQYRNGEIDTTFANHPQYESINFTPGKLPIAVLRTDNGEVPAGPVLSEGQQVTFKPGDKNNDPAITKFFEDHPQYKSLTFTHGMPPQAELDKNDFGPAIMSGTDSRGNPWQLLANGAMQQHIDPPREGITDLITFRPGDPEGRLGQVRSDNGVKTLYQDRIEIDPFETDADETDPNGDAAAETADGNSEGTEAIEAGSNGNAALTSAAPEIQTATEGTLSIEASVVDNVETVDKENKRKIEESQRRFTDRGATAEERAEALQNLERLLDTQNGQDRIDLQAKIDVYKVADSMYNLQDSTRGFTVESLIPMVRDPVTAERALEGLVSVAHGGNGDQQQARFAQDVLIKIARDNPDPAFITRTIDQLLNHQPGITDKKQILDTASEIARGLGQPPESLKKALEAEAQAHAQAEAPPRPDAGPPDPRITATSVELVHLQDLAIGPPPNAEAVNLINTIGGAKADTPEKTLAANMTVIDGLLTDLAKPDAVTRLNAMTKIDRGLHRQDGSNSLQARLNHENVEQLVGDTGPQSSEDELKQTQMALLEGRNAAREDGDYKGAAEYQDRVNWAGTALNITQLNEIRPDDPEALKKAAQIINTLVEQSFNGNPHARRALSMMAAGGDGNGEAVPTEIGAVGGTGFGNELPVPKLDFLPAEQQATIREKLGAVIKDLDGMSAGKPQPADIQSTTRPDGTIERVNLKTQETTIVARDGSEITRDTAGNVVHTRDILGNDRFFKWSDDHKTLLGVNDETGNWISRNGLDWRRTDGPGQMVGTRGVDENGNYRLNDVQARQQTVFGLAGSRQISRPDGSGEIVNHRGESISFKEVGEPKHLAELTEPDGKRWTSEDGKTFVLMNGDSPTEVKAEITKSSDGTVQRKVLEESRDAAKKAEISNDIEYKPNGTAIAHDALGRIQLMRGIHGERTTMTYASDTATTPRMVETAYRDGRRETIYIGQEDAATERERSPYGSIPPRPGVDETIVISGGAFLDQKTGQLTMYGTKDFPQPIVDRRYGTGSNPDDLPHVHDTNRREEVKYDSLVRTLDRGLLAYHRQEDGRLRLDDIYRLDTGGRERLNSPIDGKPLESREVANPDGSVAKLDGDGKVTSVDVPPLGRVLDITNGADGEVTIREINGTQWQSIDGNVFRNSVTGETLQGKPFVNTDGTYGFKLPGGSTLTRDARSGESVYSKVGDFNFQRRVNPNGDTNNSLVVTDTGGTIERDARGLAIATRTETGITVAAKRDADGNLTEATVNRPGLEPLKYEKIGDVWQLNGKPLPKDTKLELTYKGDLVQFGAAGFDKPDLVLKLDGTRIEFQESSEDVAGGYKYVVENARGEISEYHYSGKRGTNDFLERIKEGGTRTQDNHVHFETSMMRMRSSATNGQSTWAILQSQAVATETIPAGKTWVGSREFDAKTGSTLSYGHLQDGKKADVIDRSEVRTADGWTYDPTSSSLERTRVEPNGAVLRSDAAGNIESFVDRRKTTFTVGRDAATNMVNDVVSQPTDGRSPALHLHSDDGKTWTRTSKDAAGVETVETFTGNVIVSPDGVITERHTDGSFRRYTPAGAEVRYDAVNGTAFVHRAPLSGGDLNIASFGSNGQPNKIINSDGSYKTTADGTTWVEYDKDGVATGSVSNEKFEYDRVTGDLTITRMDGSMRPAMRAFIGADGVSRIETNVGPGGSLVVTSETNQHNEFITHEYRGGVKQTTKVGDMDTGTIRNYQVYRENGPMQMTSFVDVHGRETQIEWNNQKRPPEIKSYTDEYQDKWEQQTDGSYLRTTHKGPPSQERHYGRVFVNTEGNLEVSMQTSSSLTAAIEDQTRVRAITTRGIDGNTITTFDEHGGLVVKGRENIVNRTVAENGQVHIYEVNHNADGSVKRDKFGEPEIITIKSGDYKDSDAWHLYTVEVNGQKLPMVWKSDSGQERREFWRVDQVTGDETILTQNLNKARYSLSSGTWSDYYGGNELRENADQAARVLDTWGIYWLFKGNRYTDLNSQIQNLTGDEMQMVQYNLQYVDSRRKDMQADIASIWNAGHWQRTALEGHLRRTAHTREADHAEHVDVRLRAALAQMEQPWVQGSPSELARHELEVRTELAAQNNLQLELLKRAHDADNPRALLDAIESNPAWANAPEIHKRAVAYYYDTPADQRKPEDEARLIEAALEYVGPHQTQEAKIEFLKTEFVRNVNRNDELSTDEVLESVQREARNNEQLQLEEPPYLQQLNDYLKKDISERSAEEQTLLINAIYRHQMFYSPQSVLQRSEYLREFAGKERSSAEARALVQSRQGDDRLVAAFVPEAQRDGQYDYQNSFISVPAWDQNRMVTLGRDFLRDGKAHPATILQDDNWGFGVSKENVEDTASNLTDEDRAKVQHGMDLQMAREGAFGAEERTKVDALLDKNNTSPEAVAARADHEFYMQLRDGTVNMATVADARRQNEYIASIAGQNFLMNMGEANVGTTVWWNADRHEHMKPVQNIDRASFDLLASDRSMRALALGYNQTLADGTVVHQNGFMLDHFNYERGLRARDLLKAKLDYADKLRTIDVHDLHSILPGIQSLSTQEFNQLLDSREYEKVIQRGAAIQAQINEGQALRQRISAGENFDTKIAEGKISREGLNQGDAEDLALYLASKAGTLTIEQSAALARFDLQAQGKPPADEAEAKALETYKDYRQTQALVQNLAEGRTLSIMIDESTKNGTPGPVINPHQQQVLEQFRAWQRSEGQDGSAQVSEGEKIAARILAMPVDQREKARLALSDSERDALEAVETIKRGTELLATVERGRDVSERIKLDPSLKASLTPEETAQLRTYQQYLNNQLPPSQRDAIDMVEAKAAYERDPDGAKLDEETAARLNKYEQLRTYREDSSGLDAFLDGREVAQRLAGLSASDQQAELKRMEGTADGGAQLNAYESYRQTVYELTRQNVRTEVGEALIDALSFANEYDAMYDAIENMTAQQRLDYANNAAVLHTEDGVTSTVNYRDYIDAKVAYAFGSNPGGLHAAQHLLHQIERDPGHKPQRDVVFKLFETETGKGAEADLKSLLEGFNGPLAADMRRRLDTTPGNVYFDPAFKKAFDDAVAQAFPKPKKGDDARLTDDEWREKVNKQFVEPIIKSGTPEISVLVAQLESTEAAKMILGMSKETLSGITGDSIDASFSSSQAAVLKQVVAQGEVRTEDKLRALHLGLLPRDELTTVLSELNSQTGRSNALDQYALKYDSNAQTDMLALAAPKDQGRVRAALRHRDWINLEHLENLTQQVHDTVGTGVAAWDGSRLRLDAALQEAGYTLGDANRRYAPTLSESQLSRLEGNVWHANDGYVRTQEQMADVIIDGATMAAAAALTVASGGTLGPMMIASFTLAAAMVKLYGKAAFMGGNYDATVRQMTEDLAKGGLNGFTAVFGPSELLAMSRLGSAAATRASTKFLEEAAFKGLDAAGRKSAQEIVEQVIKDNLQRAVLAGGKLNVDDRIVAEAMEQLMAKGLMHSDDAMMMSGVLRKTVGSAIQTEGGIFVKSQLARETLAMTTSFASGELGAVAMTATDLYFRDALNFDQATMGELGSAAFRGMTGSLAGHGLGRLSGRAAEGIRRMAGLGDAASGLTHSAVSGLTITGGMFATNWATENAIALYNGQTFDGSGLASQTMSAMWAPFFQQQRAIGDYFRSQGRPAFSLGFAPPRVAEGEVVNGRPQNDHPAAAYQKPRLQDADFTGRTAVLEDATGTITGGGVVEVRGADTDITINARKDGDPLVLVVADADATKNIHIAADSGPVKIVIPEGAPITPEFADMMVERMRAGNVEFHTLNADGSLTRVTDLAQPIIDSLHGRHPDMPRLWTSNRNLSAEEQAALRETYKDALSRIVEPEVAEKYVEAIARAVEATDGDIRTQVAEFQKVDTEFNTASSAVLKLLFPDTMPAPADLNEANLRTLAQGDDTKMAAVENFLTQRTLRGKQLGALNESLDVRMKAVEDSINKFAVENGFPPIKIQRYGELQAGSAAYRDGVLKIRSEHLLNPERLAVATMHEFVHADQDADILRLISDELDLTGKPLDQAAVEKIAARYDQLFASHRVELGGVEHWQKFIRNSLEGHNVKLEGTDLARAQSMRDSFASVGQYAGKTDAEIRRSYSVINDNMIELNKEPNGALGLLLRLKGTDGTTQATLGHLFEGGVLPQEVRALADQVDPSNLNNPELARQAKELLKGLFTQRVESLNRLKEEAYNQYMDVHEQVTLLADQVSRSLARARFDASSILQVGGDTFLTRDTASAGIGKPVDTVDDALSNGVKRRSSVLDNVKTTELREAAGRSMDTLDGLLHSGKVDPTTAIQIQELMHSAARGNPPQVLSPESVELLSKLTPAEADKFFDISLGKFVKVLNQGGLDATTLKAGLADPDGFNNALSAVSGTRANRTVAQANHMLGLPADQQAAFKEIFNSDAVSSQALDMVMARLNGESSGNAVVDGILTPELTNKLLVGSDEQRRQLRYVADLLDKHVDGTLTRSPDFISQMLAMDPAATPDLSTILRNARVDDARLQTIFTDIARSDRANQGMQARFHLNLTLSADKVDLHRAILEIDDENLRAKLTASAGMGHVSVEQVKAIVEHYASTPETAALIDKLLADQSPTKNRINLIEKINAMGLDAPELSKLTSTLDSIQVNDLEAAVTSRGVDGLRTLVDLVSSGKITDRQLILDVAQDRDGTAITRAILDGDLHATDVSKLLALKYEHLADIRALLRAHNDGNLVFKPGEISTLMGDEKSAYYRALEIEPKYHGENLIERKTQQIRARDNMQSLSEHLDQTGRNNLDRFLREQIEALSQNDRTRLNRLDMRGLSGEDLKPLLEQLDYIVTQLKADPGNPDMIRWANRFPGSSMEIAAHMAGVRSRIPEGEYVVLMHGTDAAWAQDTIDTHGGTLSGTHGSARVIDDTNRGVLHTTDSLRAARLYADMSPGEARGPAGLVGIAIPKEVYMKLVAEGKIKNTGSLILNGDGNISHSRQWNGNPPLELSIGTETVITPDAYQALRDQGFFFQIKPHGAYEPSAKTSTELAAINARAEADAAAAAQAEAPAPNPSTKSSDLAMRDDAGFNELNQSNRSTDLAMRGDDDDSEFLLPRSGRRPTERLAEPPIKRELELKYRALTLPKDTIDSALQLDPYTRRMFIDPLVNGDTPPTRVEFTGAMREAKAYAQKPTLESVLQEHNLSISDMPASWRNLRLDSNQEIGDGAESVVLKVAPSPEFPDGGALKISESLKANWGKRPFDAEVLKGPITVDGKRIYVQKLLEVPVEDNHPGWERFEKLLASRGYEWADGGKRQVGIDPATGELKLLDYNSVKKKGAVDDNDIIAQETELNDEIDEAGVRGAGRDTEADSQPRGRELDGDLGERRADAIDTAPPELKPILEQLFDGISTMDDIIEMTMVERGLFNLDETEREIVAQQVRDDVEEAQRWAREANLMEE
jgi:hypothetical protein